MKIDYDISFKASKGTDTWQDLVRIAAFHETTPQATIRFLVAQERLRIVRYEQECNVLLDKKRTRSINFNNNG